jgi:DivIVA domain-containing protein
VDRDAIQRRDFPVGRRGYDAAAVDAHLRAVADELESLRERPPAPARELSAGTAEQVRKILEAAERSATELRDEAAKEAGDHVERVEIAAGRMLGKLDGLQRQLDALLDGLKRSGAMLEDGLARLREDVGAVASDASPPPPPAPPGPPEPDAVPEPVVIPAVAPAIDEPADPAAIAAATNGAPPPPAPGDDAGARLVALNMALSGTPREETAAYLAEHYGLADAETLLDDVYSRAGGSGT